MTASRWTPRSELVEVLGAVELHAGRLLQVELREANGRRFVTLRSFVVEEDGSRFPLRQRVNLPTARLGLLADVLGAATATLRRFGVVEPRSASFNCPHAGAVLPVESESQRLATAAPLPHAGRFRHRKEKETP